METKIENRVESLEKEILKYKKTTIIALVFSIVCGGGGLLGLASWVTSLSKSNKEVDKIQVETQKLELEIVKDSLEISMNRFNEFQVKHNSEIESIARHLELNKSLGNTDQVSVLTALLITKEQQFQNLISTTTQMCLVLARNTGAEQWINKYVAEMQSLKRESVSLQKDLAGLR